MRTPGSSGSITKKMGKMSVHNNNNNEETKFMKSKKFKSLMRELYNVSGGREGYMSYIPSRVVNRYIFKGISVNQAIHELERRVKDYNKLNKILTHTENFNRNRFNQFIRVGINRGMLSETNAAMLGRERLKRAKSKEPKSPSRIEKRKRYENELKNMSRSEAKNKLERLFRGHKIDFRNYEYLNRIIEKPRKFKHKRKSSPKIKSISSMEKLTSVVNKELKKIKNNNK